VAADASPPPSELTIFDAGGNHRTVSLPPNATVRLGDRELFIPAGVRKVAGPYSGGYELVTPSQCFSPSRRARVRAWLHALVERLVP
jgi:hypothetical protein